MKHRTIRFFQNGIKKVLAINLTFDQAQAHCQDAETSSRTCTSPEGKALTETYGDWFDGYQEYSDRDGVDPMTYYAHLRPWLNKSGFPDYGQPIRVSHLMELMSVS